MTEIVWGPEIAVNGVRPAWLADDVDVRLLFSDALGGEKWTTGGGQISWPHVPAIRLPADHFAYIAIDKGVEPWGGGDTAPDDWDGDRYGVLYRDGNTLGRQVNSWEWQNISWDIIGYRKKVGVEPAFAAIRSDYENAGLISADTVTIARMTEAEAVTWWQKERPGWSSRVEVVVVVLKTLGLIREETTAERFTRETGHEVTAAVEAALAWVGEGKVQ